MASPKRSKTPRTPRTPKTPRPPSRRKAAEAFVENTLTKTISGVAFEATTVFQPQIGIMATRSDDEAVLADPLRHRHFRINSTGAFIWENALEGKTLSQISAALHGQFTIDVKAAREIADEFLHELVDNGLLVHSTD